MLSFIWIVQYLGEISIWSYQDFQSDVDEKGEVS